MNKTSYLPLFMIFLALTISTLLPTPAKSETPPAERQEPVTATIGEDGIQRLDLIGGEYYYQPNHIILKVNTPVELRVKKTGGFIPHNIIVKAPEAGINFNVDMNNDFRTINFTPTKTGKYTMYCDHSFLWFKNHQEKGMEGVIEVVE